MVSINIDTTRSIHRHEADHRHAADPFVKPFGTGPIASSHFDPYDPSSAIADPLTTNPPW